MTIYTERQRLKYTASQLFDLVADVERYPDFMPWVLASRVRHRNDRTILVEMTIAAGPLRKRFSATAILNRPHRIDISSRDAIFDRYEQWWTFLPTPEGDTQVECRVDLKLRSRLLQMLMAGPLADRTAATMSAFKHRAHRLYHGQS